MDSVDLPKEEKTVKKRAKKGKSKFTHFKSGGQSGRPSSTSKDSLHYTAEDVCLPGTSNLQKGIPPEPSRSENQSGDYVQDDPVSPFALADFTVTERSIENPTTEIEGINEPTGSEVSEDIVAVRNITQPDQCLIDELLSQLKHDLPSPWISVVEADGIHIFLLTREREKAIRRRVFFSFSGEVEISVHRKPIPETIFESILRGSGTEQVALTKEQKDKFTERVLKVVHSLMTYDICVGVNEPIYKRLWDLEKSGAIDRNPFGEIRYIETFRHFDCYLLVPTQPSTKRRCSVCIQAKIKFTQKTKTHKDETSNPNTPNVHLDRDQLLSKVERQHKDLKSARAQIARLKAQVQNAIKTDGVLVDEGISEELCSALSEVKVTPIQELFLKEQVKAASVQKACGRRWHPTILRFALLLKTTSTAAYEAVKDSGVIILPSERTLFEYSHASLAQEGCTKEKLNRVCKQLAEKFREPHQQYHLLMMDEMHINKKLVYQKSTGEMVGYMDLSDADKEIIQLEAEMKGEKVPDSPPMATKMLVFMVKGISNGICEIVGTYPTVDNLDGYQVSNRVWEVIGALERSGVRIIAVVSDGAAVNRAFYSSYLPLTKSANVVFDTVNLAARTRPIYFFSDVPHLLKNIRNCIYKSGSGLGYARLLTKNNQVIVWQTIRKLFSEDKLLTLRRCHKLNANNVNLNPYSVMKVSYAAQVMSNTVALDIESRNWPGTSETVKFIKEVNDFFDRLNGAHSEQGKRKANKNLDPYTDVNDVRFDQLLGFLDYLNEWNAEVQAKPGFSAKEKAKMILSRQTLEGIEMTVRSFIGATRFLLKDAGVNFVNARVFCQDPLERYFGKQRQSGGGSRNPTVAQFSSNEVKINVHKDMNVRKGDVFRAVREMEVSEEPLPNRGRPST